MTPAEVWAVGQPKLEGLIGITISEVGFVDDRLVDYGSPERVYVRRRSIFRLGADDWAMFIRDVPAWLHLNLLRSDDGSCVVTLRRSETSSLSGIPNVNVSAEKLPLAIEEE